ncbi:MAG: hypothetical protein JO069_05265 [Verrucomicrobia bacterium]|nr:hypothetical protein [Verrucomicrobiota bacterium]
MPLTRPGQRWNKLNLVLVADGQQAPQVRPPALARLRENLGAPGEKLLERAWRDNDELAARRLAVGKECFAAFRGMTRVRGCTAAPVDAGESGGMLIAGSN